MAVDLSKKTKLKDPQQITFSGKPDEVNEATVFFIIEKSEETTFNFSQNSTTIINNGNTEDCKFVKWF